MSDGTIPAREISRHGTHRLSLPLHDRGVMGVTAAILEMLVMVAMAATVEVIAIIGTAETIETLAIDGTLPLSRPRPGPSARLPASQRLPGLGVTRSK